MKNEIEKFTIKITNQEVIIQSGDDHQIYFTPAEALMVLDILKNEESRLKKLAEEASPLPIKIKI